MKYDWLDFSNQGHKFWGFIGQSYLKKILEPITTQNLGSLLMKLSQSNFNLQWSPDSDLVRSYLIATIIERFVFRKVWNFSNLNVDFQILYASLLELVFLLIFSLPVRNKNFHPPASPILLLKKPLLLILYCTVFLTNIKCFPCWARTFGPNHFEISILNLRVFRRPILIFNFW